MSDQGSEYASFIKGELDREYGRRDAVNARASAGVVSASGLVTLTFAVVAVIKGQNFRFEHASAWFLFAGLFLFLASGILAVLAGMNWRYEVTSIKTLNEMRSSQWTNSEVAARNIAAYCNVKTISTMRAGNNVKYALLLSAGFIQVGALLAVAVCALLVFV